MTETSQSVKHDGDLEGTILIQNEDEIPQFANEDEEDAFWETHTLAHHFFTYRGPRPGSALERIAKRRQHSETQQHD